VNRNRQYNKSQYAWQRGWKPARPSHNYFFAGIFIVIIISLVIIGLTLIISNIQHLVAMLVAAMLMLGAVMCWLIIAFIGWRWLRDRTGYMSVQRQQSPRYTTNSASREPKQLIQPIVNTVPPIYSSFQTNQGPKIPSASLSPAQFEQEVAWVFGHRFGLRSEVVGKANDGGIDVKLYDSAGTLVGIIQAKRYDEHKALNPGFLRELDSCKRRMGVANAYLVTTARFSVAVCQQSQEMGINLVDGQLFESWRQSAYTGNSY